MVRLLKHIATAIVVIFGIISLQGCIYQKSVAELKWNKVNANKSVNYTFVEVGPDNIQEVVLDAEERFKSECLIEPDPDRITHPITTDDYQYKLGVGDEVFIKISAISGDPEYFAMTGRDLIHIFPEREVRGPQVSYQVDARGFLSLPYVGQFFAVGMTTYEVQARLQEQSRRYYKNTFVEVKMATFGGYFVDVVGAVNKMRRIPMDNQPMTVMRALMLANGPNGAADLREAFVRRSDGSVFPIDLVELLYFGDNRYNYMLEHGDTLVLPRTREDRIFIDGEVDAPDMIETQFMQFFLLDALLRKNSSSKKHNERNTVYVLRGTGMLGRDRHIQTEYCNDYVKNHPPGIYVYKFEMKIPQMKAVAATFPLYNRDLVYISSTTIQNYDRLVEQLLPGEVYDHYEMYIPLPDYNEPDTDNY